VLALAVLAEISHNHSQRGGAAGGGGKVGSDGLDLQVGAKVLAFFPGGAIDVADAKRCSHLVTIVH
jgi:hypothetical protein